MSESEFDKMFAEHMVADHKKDIADYEEQAKIKDEAGEYSSSQLPTLKKHLDAAQKLSGNPGASKPDVGTPKLPATK